MKTILVTGGAGFVGSNLAIKLKEHNSNQNVMALDNLKRRGSELNLDRLRHCGTQFIHGDVRNREDLLSLSKIDLIIECSAEPSVLSGYSDQPDYMINTNLFGSINCLELARKWNAPIIFLSTSRIYPIKLINNLAYESSDTRFEWIDGQSCQGFSKKGISESFPLDGARSLYGATKLASELIIQEYADIYGVEAVIYRCGVITGPWQMGKVDQGVVALWVAKHLYNKKLKYIGYGGEGKQVRDLLHIDDLYKLISIQIDDNNSSGYHVFNVGGGLANSLSLKELTQLCQQYTEQKIEIEPVKENRAGDIPIYITDHQKVSDATGWVPSVSPEQIVSGMTAWIRENQNMLSRVLS